MYSKNYKNHIIRLFNKKVLTAMSEEHYKSQGYVFIWKDNTLIDIIDKGVNNEKGR